jgi:hypothetical protein
MPRKALTSEEKAIVERLSGLSYKYTRIFDDQAIVLRRDLTQYYETYNKLSTTAPPLGWKPPPAKLAECLRQAAATCEIEPCNFEEYVFMPLSCTAVNFAYSGESKFFLRHFSS